MTTGLLSGKKVGSKERRGEERSTQVGCEEREERRREARRCKVRRE